MRLRRVPERSDWYTEFGWKRGFINSFQGCIFWNDFLMLMFMIINQ